METARVLSITGSLNEQVLDPPLPTEFLLCRKIGNQIVLLFKPSRVEVWFLLAKSHLQVETLSFQCSCPMPGI